MKFQLTKKHVWCSALAILTNFLTPQFVVAAEIEPKIQGTSTVCKGGLAQLSAIIKEGNDYASFQWQISVDNIHFSDIKGAVSNEFVSPELTQTTYFRVKVQGGETGIEEMSETIAVNVVPRPSLEVTVSDYKDVKNVVFEANLTGGVDCKIQWQVSNDAGKTWNNIENALGKTFAPDVVSEKVNYRAKALCSGVGCCN